MPMWYYPPETRLKEGPTMRDKSTLDAGLTPFLWVGAVLLFIITEAQIILSYVHIPTQHTWLDVGRLLGSLLVLSVPGIAGLKAYSVVRRWSSAIGGDDEGKLIWLERQFLTASIFAYVAIGWVTR
jgi:hypothetical protein